MLLKFSSLHQIIRYGVVGILNNLLCYFLYLMITIVGLDPKVAITILYPIGITIAYFSHAKYSFSTRGKRFNIFLRFLFAYLIGYGINFMMLLILADKLMLPHQVVQALSLFVVGAVLFILYNYLVFPKQSKILYE